MILYTMGNILLGMSFFKKYSMTLHLTNFIVRLTPIVQLTSLYDPRDYPPAQATKWDIQTTNVGAQGIIEGNDCT